MKKLFVFLCITIFLMGCSTSEGKFVGSRDTENFSCDVEIYKTEERLIADSELVILGTVGKASLVEENFAGETLYASKVQVTVSEVIKGQNVETSLYVLQSGMPDSDDFETKLKAGKEYLLFLNSKTFGGETVFDCTGLEQGIVEVRENGELYCYADFGISATFDGETINAFKSKLELK